MPTTHIRTAGSLNMMLITELKLVVRKTDAVRFDKKLTRMFYQVQLRPLFKANITYEHIK